MEKRTERHFANGSVYCLALGDGKLIEVTDTFLPFYTKDAIGRKQNMLLKDDANSYGSREERWMVGVSTMSGCPVGCKFCATGQMKSPWRSCSADEIVEQVEWVVSLHPDVNPRKCKEFKVNMTRMGEPALNWDNVHKAADILRQHYPNVHVFISTIGIKGTDFSWIEGDVTLQISLHSFDEAHRNWLIPVTNKMTIKELGQIRTKSNLKTTVNLTLVDESDFDIDKLKKYFDPAHFFIKLSPINKNATSEGNNLGSGVIKGRNLDLADEEEESVACL